MATKLKKEILDKINLTLDYAIETFLADPEVIYTTELDRTKLKYADADNLRDWVKTQSCIHDGCTKKSISKSHTIQKASSLRQISEGGMVLTPRLDQECGELKLIAQSIGDASTFPGFCEDHEKLFLEFENKKDLITQNHFILQSYRTICREIVISEKYLKILKSALSRYIEYRNKKVRELFITKLGSDFIGKNNIEIKDFKFKGGDQRENKAESGISILKYHLASMRNLKAAITNDLIKKKSQKIACISKIIDVEIPVCIAGRDNFRIKQKSKVKEVEIIFNVLPHSKKTYVVICALKKYSRKIQLYLDHFRNPLQILSLIESWMVHGSDHWFIKPSEWAKIDLNRRNRILADIYDLSKNIGHDYPLSIFDDLRKKAIKLLDDNFDKLNKPLVELLEREREKLSFSST